jgi:hypothetical protein
MKYDIMVFISGSKRLINMNIAPEECGKFHKEVRNWQTGKPRIIKMRCKKPLECSFCGGIEIAKYKTPINDYINQGGEIHFFLLSNDDWSSVRKGLFRSDSHGYVRLPISQDEFVLIADTKLSQSHKELDHIDLDKTILQSRKINQEEGSSLRRTATGIFKKQSIENGTIEVEWPEPVFYDKEYGQIVASSKIATIINEFIQYLSPLTEITPDNVNFYLDYRSRLKADIVVLLHPNYEVKGFNVSTRLLNIEDFNEWNIIPLSSPQKANMSNNPIGAQLVDKIFFGKISSYEGYPRDLALWSDYKSEDELFFDEL